MSREFAETILAATMVMGFYVLIMALAEGLSEWLTKRVLRKGRLVEDTDDKDLVEVSDGDIAEYVVEDVVKRPEEPTRYARLRSSYRRNRRQARRR